MYAEVLNVIWMPPTQTSPPQLSQFVTPNGVMGLAALPVPQSGYVFFYRPKVCDVLRRTVPMMIIISAVFPSFEGNDQQGHSHPLRLFSLLSFLIFPVECDLN